MTAVSIGRSDQIRNQTLSGTDGQLPPASRPLGFTNGFPPGEPKSLAGVGEGVTIRETPMKILRVAVLLFVSAVTASLADETNTLPSTITVDGITYSNVQWRTVTPATVSIFHQTGVASIPLEKLPPELQQRFGYDPQKAADYAAKDANTQAIYRQQAAQAAAKAAATQVAPTPSVQDPAAAKNAESSSTSVRAIRFTRVFNLRQRGEGLYCANITSDGGTTLYVEFDQDGYTYMRDYARNIPEGFGSRPEETLYGIGEQFDLVNEQGTQFHEYGYRLIGHIQINRMGGETRYSW